MKYFRRTLESEITRAAKGFPAVLLTGPRRSGKTTLLRHLYSDHQYVLLEDPDVLARAGADPRAFLDGLSLPVILDEIQNLPELFPYIRSRIDADPTQNGLWILAGSQEAPLMRGVSESMAGRAAVFSLLPLSAEESPLVSPFLGGFPEALAAPEVADIWFRSYVLTYLERDVRAIAAIRDLVTFRRFIGLLATRCGQMLNKTDLAAPLGVSVPTLSQWLGILEITGQIILVAPWYENYGKRVVKTPKLYFTDCGLAASLLGIRDEASLAQSPFRGALFESLVASEILKYRLGRGLERGLYYFRDRQGLEVDFIVDNGNRRLVLIEAKATQTPMPDDARPIARLLPSLPASVHARALVVCDEAAPAPVPLGPHVRPVSWRRLHKALADDQT
jgi:predicted AAA+ superfamily ATPase